jgi:THO complex subunit 4
MDLSAPNRDATATAKKLYPQMHSQSRSKRQLIGNPAAQVHPAWKLANYPSNSFVQQSKDKHKAEEVGSKILLSRLPADVGENEIEVRNIRSYSPFAYLFVRRYRNFSKRRSGL